MALAIGFPFAYGMAKAPERWRALLLMLVILPFWTSFLIRVYAWIGILKPEGFLNQFLMWTGVIDTPLAIMNTNTAVYIGIVYSYLPFMVLPIYSTLEKMDNSLIEAAVDLGCNKISAFWLVTVPLALPGIIAGCFLVFIPAVGEFVIPDLLGRHRYADDRQDLVEGILLQPRLAGCLGGCHRAAAAAGSADIAVPENAGTPAGG